ncbi:hypothetical protein [Spirosoma areae]
MEADILFYVIVGFIALLLILFIWGFVLDVFKKFEADTYSLTDDEYCRYGVKIQTLQEINMYLRTQLGTIKDKEAKQEANSLFGILYTSEMSLKNAAYLFNEQLGNKPSIAFRIENILSSEETLLESISMNPIFDLSPPLEENSPTDNIPPPPSSFAELKAKAKFQAAVGKEAKL